MAVNLTGSLEITGSLSVNGSTITPGGGGDSTPMKYFVGETPTARYNTASTIHVSESGQIFLIEDNGTNDVTYDIIWYPELFSEAKDPTYLSFYTNAGSGRAMIINSKISCSAAFETYSYYQNMGVNNVYRTTKDRYYNFVGNGMQNGYLGSDGNFYGAASATTMQYIFYKLVGPQNYP